MQNSISFQISKLFSFVDGNLEVQAADSEVVSRSDKSRIEPESFVIRAYGFLAAFSVG
jgi:hypothetical protein